LPTSKKKTSAPEEKIARLCDECGEPIAPARLRVLPETRYCIDCAEDLEEEQKSRQSRGDYEFHGGEHDEESLVETLRDLTES
jgi:uncharacterized protein YlaI